MRKLPYWADGAIFGTLLVPLVFFLKIVCPVDTGCFIDPFLVPLFSPLFILEHIFGSASQNFSPKIEIIFITIFWGVVVSLLAHLWGKIIQHRARNIEHKE